MESNSLYKMPPFWPTEAKEGYMMGTDCGLQEKKAFGSFRKVSKPLMEKKRRARINVSLEQLKALLEKDYSHQIQKRKLEKADILELSVKYMKSLQRTIQGAPAATSADFQAGFRSCLQGVRQFLLRSEAAREASPSLQLLQELARALPGGVALFSTRDSSPAVAELAGTPGCGQRDSPSWGAGGQAQARSQALPEQLWRPW